MSPRKRRSRRKPKSKALAVRKAPETETTAEAPVAPAADDPRIEATLEPILEAMSENEALTSNLQDSEAKRLLAWARVQAESLVRQALAIEDPAKSQAALEEGTADLRRRMRSVNQKMEEAYEGDVPASERLETLLREAAG